MLPGSRTRKVNPLYFGADWACGRERGSDQRNLETKVMKERKPPEVIQLLGSQAMEWQGLRATLEQKVESRQQETGKEEGGKSGKKGRDSIQLQGSQAMEWQGATLEQKVESQQQEIGKEKGGKSGKEGRGKDGEEEDTPSLIDQTIDENLEVLDEFLISVGFSPTDQINDAVSSTQTVSMKRQSEGEETVKKKHKVKSRKNEKKKKPSAPTKAYNFYSDLQNQFLDTSNKTQFEQLHLSRREGEKTATASASDRGQPLMLGGGGSLGAEGGGCSGSHLSPVSTGAGGGDWVSGEGGGGRSCSLGQSQEQRGTGRLSGVGVSEVGLFLALGGARVEGGPPSPCGNSNGGGSNSSQAGKDSNPSTSGSDGNEMEPSKKQKRGQLRICPAKCAGCLTPPCEECKWCTHPRSKQRCALRPCIKPQWTSTPKETTQKKRKRKKAKPADCEFCGVTIKHAAHNMARHVKVCKKRRRPRPSPDRMALLLASIHLSEDETADLLNLFKAEHIDLDVLKDMSHEDLKSIGISSFGVRHKILRGAATEDLTPPPPPPSPSLEETSAAALSSSPSLDSRVLNQGSESELSDASNLLLSYPCPLPNDRSTDQLQERHSECESPARRSTEDLNDQEMFNQLERRVTNMTKATSMLLTNSNIAAAYNLGFSSDEQLLSASRSVVELLPKLEISVTNSIHNRNSALANLTIINTTEEFTILAARLSNATRAAMVVIENLSVYDHLQLTVSQLEEAVKEVKSSLKEIISVPDPPEMDN